MNGMPGTSMPSFSVLPPDEVAALLEYVKYLSMRGQMETALVNFVVDNLDYDPVTGEATRRSTRERPDSAGRDYGPVGRRRRRQVGSRTTRRSSFRRKKACPAIDRNPAEVAASVRRAASCSTARRPTA